MSRRLERSFYTRDVLSVAPELPGKVLVRRYEDGSILRKTILEVEAYRGVEDLACHASKGRTKRTEIMYHTGGMIYMYLIYGMYWMLNFVTGEKETPQAVLIRGIEGFNGPGRLTRGLTLDKSFYGVDLVTSDMIWVEDTGDQQAIISAKRIGIDYAGDPWKNMNWRFVLTGDNSYE